MTAKSFRFGQSAQFEMEAQWRIESVERALEHLEDFLPHAKNQAFLRKRQELKAAKEAYDREAIEAELDMMELEWRGRFPANFYGSLVVLLWAELEKIIERFAAEVRSIKHISLAFKDVGGSSAYSRLRKYVEAVLGVSLPDNSAVEDLEFLRNLYAHHGGDFTEYQEGRLKRIKAILKAHEGVSQVDEFIIANAIYLRSAVEAANGVIKALREAHPSTEPGLVELDT
jgi:hypothetical protein